MVETQVIEGTCDEIRVALDNPELAGRQLKLIVVLPDEPSSTHLDEAVFRMMHRTPEEKAQARARALQRYLPARPLPPGKTLAETIAGQWPGDETDEEIEAALDELS